MSQTTEQRAAYETETAEEGMNAIRDEAPPRDYFSQMPNIVDIMDLSPHAYRLYGHLRKVGGEGGKCWQSTRTLALACKMSTGAVSNAKKELKCVYPPLIRIESKKFDRGEYHEIAITDVWAINHAFFAGAETTIKRADGAVVHNMNEWRSLCEQDRSPGETKKNPLEEEPILEEEGETQKINLFREFERRIHPITPLVSERLPELEQEHTAHWVLEAMKVSEGAGKRYLNHTIGVLKRWKVDGYGTAYPAKEKKQHGNSNHKTSNQRPRSELSPAQRAIVDQVIREQAASAASP